MSFSSSRRNYLLTPHRRDGLIEWMKSMLSHSFVLDCLDETGADTFSHFEMLIEEHRQRVASDPIRPSRLKHLVPTVGTFHTSLPLRRAFEFYNDKHKLTNRKHIQISFNEIRHILNLAQIMATAGNQDSQDDNEAPKETSDGRTEESGNLRGPKLITFDGDQTLYNDGSNFESNPQLANCLYTLITHGVHVAVVTAAGYEYNTENYEYRLSGLLHYFKRRGLKEDEFNRFYIFGGECNYLLKLGSDYRIHAVQEQGEDGWFTKTSHQKESPANWREEEVQKFLDSAEASVVETVSDLNLYGRVIRKRRCIGLVPKPNGFLTREVLDETVLRVAQKLESEHDGSGQVLPYCCFNGGKDAWVDIGNKRVGVQMLQTYLGIDAVNTLHIGDQFLNTGNDFAARDVCPCIWVTSPDETTYILRSILRLGGLRHIVEEMETPDIFEDFSRLMGPPSRQPRRRSMVDFTECSRRSSVAETMDVYTGTMVKK